MWDVPFEVLVHAVVAGLAASVACGLGVLPLFIPGLDPAHRRGVGYAVAGGLMFAASVYNLILPGLNMSADGWTLRAVLPIVGGILLGAAFLDAVEQSMPHGAEEGTGGSGDAFGFAAWGGRLGLLVFLTMTVHSIPEGVAVGVGYTSDAKGLATDANLGPTLALAIGLRNIPEGLAVAIPMRSAGASFWRCFVVAMFTSLPQPLAAIPAVLLAWAFEPLMPLLMAFAAGAMIFLILMELIPVALQTETPERITWAFVLGFCLMLLIQVVL